MLTRGRRAILIFVGDSDCRDCRAWLAEGTQLAEQLEEADAAALALLLPPGTPWQAPRPWRRLAGRVFLEEEEHAGVFAVDRFWELLLAQGCLAAGLHHALPPPARATEALLSAARACPE